MLSQRQKQHQGRIDNIDVAQLVSTLEPDTFIKIAWEALDYHENKEQEKWVYNPLPLFFQLGKKILRENQISSLKERFAQAQTNLTPATALLELLDEFVGKKDAHSFKFTLLAKLFNLSQYSHKAEEVVDHFIKELGVLDRNVCLKEINGYDVSLDSDSHSQQEQEQISGKNKI